MKTATTNKNFKSLIKILYFKYYYIRNEQSRIFQQSESLGLDRGDGKRPDGLTIVQLKDCKCYLQGSFAIQPATTSNPGRLLNNHE